MHGMGYRKRGWGGKERKRGSPGRRRGRGRGVKGVKGVKSAKGRQEEVTALGALGSMKRKEREGRVLITEMQAWQRAACCRGAVEEEVFWGFLAHLCRHI